MPSRPLILITVIDRKENPLKPSLLGGTAE